ncbi:hypothetical protein MG293_001616, partial [Ovis ammon polii]
MVFIGKLKLQLQLESLEPGMLHDKIIISTENRDTTEFCYGVARKIHQTEAFCVKYILMKLGGKASVFHMDIQRKLYPLHSLPCSVIFVIHKRIKLTKAIDCLNILMGFSDGSAVKNLSAMQVAVFGVAFLYAGSLCGVSSLGARASCHFSLWLKPEDAEGFVARKLQALGIAMAPVLSKDVADIE